MRMTPSIKDKTSLDMRSSDCPNKRSKKQPIQLPNFDNKRKTPYFNQNSLDNENLEISSSMKFKNQKNMLKELVSAERSCISGNSQKSKRMKMSLKYQPNNEYNFNQNEFRAPRNTIILNKQKDLSNPLNFNKETRIFESIEPQNNIGLDNNNNNNNEMDILLQMKNLGMRDRSSRQTDLMNLKMDNFKINETPKRETDLMDLELNNLEIEDKPNRETNLMDLKKNNLGLDDKPNRETDLMDFELENDNIQEDYTENENTEEDYNENENENTKEDQENEDKFFKQGESESLESVESVESVEKEDKVQKKEKIEIDKITNSISAKQKYEKKAISELQRYKKIKDPRFRVGAKSDGNATLGHRSFMTSSNILIFS